MNCNEGIQSVSKQIVQTIDVSEINFESSALKDIASSLKFNEGIDAQKNTDHTIQDKSTLQLNHHDIQLLERIISPAQNQCSTQIHTIQNHDTSHQSPTTFQPAILPVSDQTQLLACNSRVGI